MLSQSIFLDSFPIMTGVVFKCLHRRLSRKKWLFSRAKEIVFKPPTNTSKKSFHNRLFDFLELLASWVLQQAGRFKDYLLVIVLPNFFSWLWFSICFATILRIKYIISTALFVLSVSIFLYINLINLTHRCLLTGSYMSFLAFFIL